MDLFSPAGERVQRILAEIGDRDESAEKFAVRVGRAITMLEAGFVGENSPLSSFIIYGSPAAPIHLFVETLSREWLGETWDGRPPLTYIDCSAFSLSYPGVLSRLSGPLPRDQYGRQPVPLFSQIKYPHFSSLGKEFLRKLWAWKEWFLSEYREGIQRLEESQFGFYLAFENLLAQEQEKYCKELEKENPFCSVIFFDAVDRACPELVEVIRRILHQGNTVVWPSELVDFSRSIIVMSIYDYENINKSEIGFRRGDEELTVSSGRREERYRRVRLNLLGKFQISGLVQDVAENLIVLGERTFESQRYQFLANLHNLEQRCHSIGISLECSKDFIDGFVRHSRDAGLNAFTDARIKIGIQRHIIYQLARLIISKEIRKGAHLLFEAAGTADKLESKVIVKFFGEGDYILPSDIEKLFFERKSFERYFNPEDLLSNETLFRVQEEAESILKRIAGVR